MRRLSPRHLRQPDRRSTTAWIFPRAAWWLVPVPGHRPGTASPVPVKWTMDLARGRAWVVPAPPPLRRVHAVAPAKDRGVRAPNREEASLRWTEASPSGSTVLLIDDVIASGATLRSCAAAIRRDSGGDREFRALVLGRAKLERILECGLR